MNENDWLENVDVPITVEQLADELMIWISDPYLFAKGIKEAYEAIDVYVPVEVLGSCMLESKYYPDLKSGQLRDILIDVGYSEEEVEEFIQHKMFQEVYEVEVDARTIWLDTGVDVRSGDEVEVEYLSGKWSFNPSFPCCGPEGRNGLPAHSGYALPGVNEGSLIGKIGSDVFYVGERVHLPSIYEGRLYLIINDDVESNYGNGFKDNSGSIILKVTIR